MNKYENLPKKVLIKRLSKAEENLEYFMELCTEMNEKFVKTYYSYLEKSCDVERLKQELIKVELGEDKRKEIKDV